MGWWTGASFTLQWRHNGRDSVSNHQPHDCFLNRLFRRSSKKTSKLRVSGLCAGNSPGTGEFPAQMASNAENVSIWWRHHDLRILGKPASNLGHEYGVTFTRRGRRYGQGCILGTIIQWCGSTIMYYSGLKLTLWGPNYSWKLAQSHTCLCVGSWRHQVSAAVMMLNTWMGFSFLFVCFLLRGNLWKKYACRSMTWILCI